MTNYYQLTLWQRTRRYVWPLIVTFVLVLIVSLGMTRPTVLGPGGSFYSRNGKYRLTYGNDGGLSIDGPGVSNPWSPRISSNCPGYVIMQSDCNLVVYNCRHVPYWSSGTSNKGSSCKLTLQDDGVLVIHNFNNLIWSSN